MYNYDFKDEYVIFEKLNTLVEIDNKDYYLNILVTNKNILLFEDINRFHQLHSKGVYMPSQNELLKKISLDNNYKIIDNNTIVDNIILYDIDIKNIKNVD